MIIKIHSQIYDSLETAAGVRHLGFAVMEALASLILFYIGLNIVIPVAVQPPVALNS